MRTDLAAHRVALAVTDQAPIFELAVPCEVFGIDRPDLADPWYDLQVCTVDPGTTVAHGFVAHGAGDMDDLVRADTVVVPACANVHRAPSPELVEAVRAAHTAGARIAAICSGAFVLAAAGLLDGRRATTHWMHTHELARRHPEVCLDPKVLYVEDGGIYTSAGTAAGLDLCLELVRVDHGAAVANALARRLVTPPHRTGGQAQYVELPAVARDDTTLGPLLEWARGRLDGPLTLTDLARQAGISRRTLARRFEETIGVPPCAGSSRSASAVRNTCWKPARCPWNRCPPPAGSAVRRIYAVTSSATWASRRRRTASPSSAVMVPATDHPRPVCRCVGIADRPVQLRPGRRKAPPCVTRDPVEATGFESQACRRRTAPDVTAASPASQRRVPHPVADRHRVRTELRLADFRPPVAAIGQVLTEHPQLALVPRTVSSVRLVSTDLRHIRIGGEKYPGGQQASSCGCTGPRAG